MINLKLLRVILLAIPCSLAFPRAEAPAQTAAFTAEFSAFLAARNSDNSAALRESSGGCQFTLENGRLCVIGADNTEIWRSKDEWYVEAFRIGDVNRDSILDIAFVVWKSYSFGAGRPARIANDDSSVRCHLFVYSIKDNKTKALWCSSNLPRPIYSFELTADGEQTPTLSGTRLITQEGAYTEDYSKTESAEYIYDWNAWGFIPSRIPSAAAGMPLRRRWRV